MDWVSIPFRTMNPTKEPGHMEKDKAREQSPGPTRTTKQSFITTEETSTVTP